MKNWLYKAGGSYDKLKIANLGTGYRGAIATKTIHVRIPLSLEKIAYCVHSEIRNHYIGNGKEKSLLSELNQYSCAFTFPKTHFSIHFLVRRKQVA